MTRRLILAAAFVAVSAAACAPTDGTATTRAPSPAPAATAATITTTTAQAGPPYGGRITIGTSEEPTSLNAYLPGAGGEAVFRIGQAYWTGVQEIDGATLTLRPEVVERLPDQANGGVVLNADGTMTVTYDIRREAVWADGTPISGNDFAFTYRAIMEQRVAVDPAVYEDIIPESIVVEPKRFAYTLQEPTILYQLLFGLVLPEHDVAGSDLAADWTDTMWVSGGPFVLAEWVRGDHLRLVRNERYWKTDAAGRRLPYLDEVVFEFLPEDELVDALLDGTVDVINVPPESATRERLAVAGIVTEVLAGPSWEHLNFQFGDGRLRANPDSMNGDVDFRRAVFHAIDRERIVGEELPGLVEGIDSYTAIYVPGISQDPWSRYDFDPDEARRLLGIACARAARDCATDPVTAVYTTTAGNDARARLAGVIGEMLADVGIAFEARLQESPVFLGDTLPHGAWDVAQWAYDATPGYVGLVSIHDVFDPEAPPPFGLNLYRWGTPGVTGTDASGFEQGPSVVRDAETQQVAALRDLMNATIDEASLAAYATEAEALIADSAVILPLFRWRELGAARAVVGGYRFNPTAATDTWNIEAWYRTDR